MTTALGDASVREAEPLQQPEMSVVRGPAYGVIAECLRLAAASPRASWLARAFGSNPLPVDARRWYRSAVGELDAIRALKDLGPEWTLMHPSRDGEIPPAVDYLLVGPAGAFTVSIKDHADQVVRFEEQTLTVNARRTNHVRDARLDAAALARLLDVRRVSSIIVIVNPRSLHRGGVRSPELANEVTVVDSAALAPLLSKLGSGQPPSLDRRAVNELVLRAEAAGRWKASSTVHDETLANEEQFARLRSDVSRAAQRRILWFGVAALALIATVAAAVLTL